MKIIVYISDESVGVENLPANVEVEVRDYRKAAVTDGTLNPVTIDGIGDAYVEYKFGEGGLPS